MGRKKRGKTERIPKGREKREPKEEKQKMEEFPKTSKERTGKIRQKETKSPLKNLGP